MKIFTKKSLILVLGCMAGTALASGQDSLSEDVSTQALAQEQLAKSVAFSDVEAAHFLEYLYEVKPATAAKIAAETGINLAGGMLSRDVSTALFPSLDVEMMRNYAALSKNDLVSFNAAQTSRFLQRWAARGAVAGLIGYLAYKTWFVPKESLLDAVPAATDGAAATDEDNVKLLGRYLRSHLEAEAKKSWVERAGDTIKGGLGVAVQYTVVPGALLWCVTQAFFNQDPASPLGRYFIDNLSSQSSNLFSSYNEYSSIVNAACNDKAQSNENVTSIASRGHAQFINTLENYCGYLVALHGHFAEQQEVASAQLEKMKTQKNVSEVVQAEKCRVLKAAKVITDVIDSTLIQVYASVNQFTSALIKSKNRDALNNVVQGNLFLLANTNPQYQEGILSVYGKQLENALYNFYGLKKPKAPDMAAMMASMGGMFGGMQG